MRKRTRKILSLLIAASMALTMNTAVFAEEAVDVETAPAVGELVEVVEDDGTSVEIDIVKDDTVEADVTAEESGGSADADAAVDGSEDAAVDAETSGTADMIYEDGLAYNSEGKILTEITYESNGDKKNPKNDVVTIKNTTDPVSWNNFNASGLLYTVLFGDNETADHLNYTSTATASKNNLGIAYGYNLLTNKLEYELEVPSGFRFDTGKYRYLVEPLTDGSSYLLMGYGLEKGWQLRFVDDENGMLKTTQANDEEWLTGIPVAFWDGRKIEYNKSGNHKFTTGKKEALDIAVAIVKYNNGTVTEVPGVCVKSVKVDKKNQKKASVAYENKTASVNLLSHNEVTGKLEPLTYTVLERDKIGDLPYFTFTANLKGSDAKAYKKDVNKILKDKKFYFGIVQHRVVIDFSEDKKYKPIQTLIKKAVVSENLFDDNGIEHSAYEVKEDDNQFKITISSDTAPIEKAIAEMISDESYFDSDVDDIIIDKGSMKISKFNGKKAVINVRGPVGDDKKDFETKDLGTLKPKKDYTIDTTGSIAGTTVNILDFPADGNYVYAGYIWKDLKINLPGTVYYSPYDLTDGLGYKYAFRKSPVEKSKKFRGGIYAKDNTGFVYEAK